MSEEPANENADVVDDSGMDFLVDMPDIPEVGEKSAAGIIEDECDVAFDFCFIGTGQGGSRIAESFWKLGYRRICCINTTNQDLAAIDIPEANKLVIGSGGAGKDVAKGEEAAKGNYENIYDLMRRCFGKKFDRIFVCIGAGGGTGSGTSNPVIDIAHDIAQSFKVEEAGGIPAVGVIASLPKTAEGVKVNSNAHGVMESLFDKVDEKNISPLVILDNEKIGEVFPNVTVDKFWGLANKNLSALFNLFNSIATKDSPYTTFDRADLKDILDAGTLSFGACPIKEWQKLTDISYSIRDNLTRNVLAGGFDFSLAEKAGCVFIGHPDVLGNIPQNFLEHGFEMLSRTLSDDSVVHRGIYQGTADGLVVYTMIGGLGRPEERMREIAKIGRI